MRQIGNWVFGSFFRTIGRLLVFVVIGFIIAKFVNFDDFFDNFKITDLFGIETVMAAEGETRYLTQYNSDGSILDTTNTPIPMYYQQIASTDSIQTLYRYFGTNGATSNDVANGFDYVKFNFMIFGATSHNYSVQSTTDDIKACRQFTCEHYNSNTNVCSQWKCLSWYTVSNGTTISDSENVNYTISLTATIMSRNNVQIQCDVDMSKSTITCPTWSRNRTGFNRLLISYNGQNAGLEPIYLGVSRPVLGTFDSDQIISDKINSQTQQQQQQHEEEMQQSQQQHEEIMDTNMTETNETASSFFSSFNTTDSGGLSSIVTAPLTMINKMLDGQCTSPSATWKGATITLPCGSMFWGRPGASQLQDLLNVFYGGFICYYAIRKLFIMIEGFKDPTNDRVEVSDL